MDWATLLNFLFGKNGGKKLDPPLDDSLPEKDKGVEQLREDQKLSDHFSLFELTVTSDVSMQKLNRTLTENQIDKLKTLAQHGECILKICGGAVNVHSGYRCDALNGVTLGSSTTSQHPKCEALDLNILNQSVEDTFTKLVTASRSGEFKFGQLILERAERSYGSTSWVHCSVPGTLPPEKVGQVLKMDAGIDGKPLYLLIERISFKS